MITAIIVVFVVPFLWSACLAVLRRIPDFKKSPQYIDDKMEKRHLALMLLPVVIGLAVAIVARFVPLALPLPVLPLAEVGEASGPSIAPAAAASAIPGVNWTYLMLMSASAAYGAGLMIHLVRLSIGLIGLRRLASRSKPAAEWGQGVRLTPAATSPLALGRATILIPEGLLHCLSQVQTQMILHHEREHLRRGDARWFVVLAVIDAVFWFNPFVRHQTRQCRLAAELACDAAVVAAAPEMRGTYAEALVRVLKHAAGDVRQYAPTAFSPEKSGDYRMRILEIMQPPARLRKPRLIVAAITAALLVPVGVAQLAWSQTLAPVAAEQPAAAPAAQGLTVAPVTAPINSGFGMRINPVTHKRSFHPGVDFGVSTGTPVKAAGNGTVTGVTEERWKMGKVIEIDNGGGLRTRYAHLGSQAVKVGDHVSAGQVIATSGNSGVSTGPHLHFEVWKDDKAIDPASVLPLAMH